jgi:hypothetical protein
MGEDVENENAFGSVVDPCDQSVVIAVYVEHGPSTNDVGVRESHSALQLTSPNRLSWLCDTSSSAAQVHPDVFQQTRESPVC